MCERQVEEIALRQLQFLVETPLDGTLGDRQRQRVGSESARGSAEHVARELIEDNDERQRAFRRRLPVGQPSRGGGLISGQEAFADRGVKGGVFRIPLLR